VSPAESLALVPGFGDAGIGRLIASGITADSFRVELNGQPYVLRIDTAEARALGLDREGEREVQRIVAGAGFMPEVVFNDPGRGVSLRRWVGGRAWSKHDLEEVSNLDRLGGLLRGIHNLPPAGSRYEPGEAARRYAAQLGTSRAGGLADEANAVLEQLRRETNREALCHNDLVAENLIDARDRLVPIDWEYAGIGDPLFDLAVLIRHHDLPVELSRRLLQAYFQREATRQETLRVQDWCRFYGLLLELWRLRVEESG